MRTSANSDAVMLRRLLARGPAVSLYFSLPPPGASESVKARWVTMLERLARHGATPAARDALTRSVMETMPGPGVLAAFVADGDSAPAMVGMPGADRPDLVVGGPVPYVRPLLAWLQNRPPHVVALVGPGGATIEIHRGGTGETAVRTVNGADGGDRSRSRGRSRVQDPWERTGIRVAEALSGHLIGGDAQLLLLAGDIRVLPHVDEHLPGSLRRRVSVRHVAARLGEPGRNSRPAAQLEQQVHCWIRERTRHLLRKITEGRGSEWAVEGTAATLAALAGGRVRALAVVDDPEDRRMARFDPATGAGWPPEGTGTPPVCTAPLVDVALRAAMLSGAEVTIIEPGTPGAPVEGMGALCGFGG